MLARSSGPAILPEPEFWEYARLVNGFKLITSETDFVDAPEAAPPTLALILIFERAFWAMTFTPFKLIELSYSNLAEPLTPFTVLFGSPDADSNPAAFFSNTAAGGVLVIKLKDLSFLIKILTCIVYNQQLDEEA